MDKQRVAAFILAPLLLWAVVAQGEADEELTELHFDDLMKLPVSSVSKRETSLIQSPAAISVITAEDIRRSGLTSLPELLRSVPGLNVARINSAEWAITARGFNDQYASKLLVLVDGRSIYTPMFAGVYWNANDIVLEDIERVEVIRGPGAALWGANAVNGVINIITKKSQDTLGSLASATYGSDQKPSGLLRYGGKLNSDTFYRAYVKYADWDGYATAPAGRDSPDSWNSIRGGMRLDRQTDRDAFMMQGEVYGTRANERFERINLTAPLREEVDLLHHNSGGHLLGHWSRDFSSSAKLSVQAYYDYFHQWDGDIVETRDTFDFDLQHEFHALDRHSIVWGTGYRYTSDKLPPTFYLTFFPAQERDRLYSAFVQDEIALITNRLALTVGGKLEHNEYTGFELQPNIRLLFSPDEQHAAWASIARAVRTPGRFHRNSRLNVSTSQFPGSPPFLVALFSTPDAVSEEELAYEVGYRIQPSHRVSFDMTAFYNDYDKLFAYTAGSVSFESEPAPAHLLLPINQKNSLSGASYGSEVAARWAPLDNWQLSAAYSWLHMHLSPDESSEAKNPQHQWQLRSDLNLTSTVQLSTAAYYVSHITSPLDDGTVSIDAYLRLDMGLQWQPTGAMQVGLYGQNLLDRHTEFGSFKVPELIEIPRSVLGRITWNFR
jgi:iron complex outermembrane receptor protein